MWSVVLRGRVCGVGGGAGVCTTVVCFSVVAQPFSRTTAPRRQASHRFVKTYSS